MSAEPQIYRELREHLDKLPIGYPTTESGVEVRILQHFFTPEEARLATQMSMMPEPLKRIHRRVGKAGMSAEELEQMLARMVSKGAIQAGDKNGERVYRLVPLAIGMFEFRVDRLDRDFVEDVFEYLNGAYGEELHRTRTPQLRTIPVGKSIALPQEYPVSTYDDIRKVVEGVEGTLVVINCICKQSKDILEDSCRHTDLREVCLLFGDMADYVLGLGIGRPIAREEVSDILEKAEEAGLVLQPQNAQRPEFVCCCCGDCCGILVSAKKFPRPAELFASNYYAAVDAGSCNGCQDCVGRCQMDAIAMAGDVAEVDLDRCIGCGNCSLVCVANAIQLRNKDRALLPPKDMDSLYMKIMSEKTGRLNMLKLGARMLLGLRV